MAMAGRRIGRTLELTATAVIQAECGQRVLLVTKSADNAQRLIDLVNGAVMKSAQGCWTASGDTITCDASGGHVRVVALADKPTIDAASFDQRAEIR